MGFLKKTDKIKFMGPQNIRSGDKSSKIFCHNLY